MSGIDVVLLIVGLFSAMSGLLYVLAVIDPQTDRDPRPSVPSA